MRRSSVALTLGVYFCGASSGPGLVCPLLFAGPLLAWRIAQAFAPFAWQVCICWRFFLFKSKAIPAVSADPSNAAPATTFKETPQRPAASCLPSTFVVFQNLATTCRMLSAFPGPSGDGSARPLCRGYTGTTRRR
ncbi:unnamed protein product, partial [Amoebophrya sp. A120]|eukprot:GSA120T00026394001.1